MGTRNEEVSSLLHCPPPRYMISPVQQSGGRSRSMAYTVAWSPEVDKLLHTKHRMSPCRCRRSSTAS